MSSVAEYIESFPEDTRELLHRLRAVILENAPGAWEGMRYGMPAYKTNGRVLVYFAGYKNHIGFYATPAGHSEFAKELSGFKQGKGSVQFPLNKPIPYDLIGRIVEFKVAENAAKPERK